MSARPVCAYCRQQPVEVTWRPFCSERCKMADLGRWLQGDYRISDRPEESSGVTPAVNEEEDDEATS